MRILDRDPAPADLQDVDYRKVDISNETDVYGAITAPFAGSEAQETIVYHTASASQCIPSNTMESMLIRIEQSASGRGQHTPTLRRIASMSMERPM